MSDLSTASLPSKSRLALLALAAIAGTVSALVLASPGDARKGADDCNGKPADVTLTGDTTYRGDRSNEVIVGDSGPQEVHGHNGKDTICGGDGNDHLAGGEANDKIFGQGGDDNLFGRPGNDDLDGGPDSTDVTFEKGTTTIPPTTTTIPGQLGDECAGGNPNPSDPTTDPDIAVDCEQERGVRQNLGS
jgi:hypothetical protein